VTKALTMPGPRIRYNAIETISMIKGAAAVPALLETAKLSNELPRIREHALRIAVRLDPLQAPPAIGALSKDTNSSIRKAAAFEARYVRHKDVIQPLIDLVGDEERYVALSAVQSLWMLTRHETDFHDWDSSSKQDRQTWAQEWVEWWNQSKDSFELPEPKSRKRAS
jgi:HEAT repeat protein